MDCVNDTKHSWRPITAIWSTQSKEGLLFSCWIPPQWQAGSDKIFGIRASTMLCRYKSIGVLLASIMKIQSVNMRALEQLSFHHFFIVCDQESTECCNFWPYLAEKSRRWSVLYLPRHRPLLCETTLIRLSDQTMQDSSSLAQPSQILVTVGGD